MLEELVRKNRSYRRFQEAFAISRETLLGLVDLARLSASGANRQPLKYILVSDPETNARVFPQLAWAGYLADWPGPQEGERPSAYIVILVDTALPSRRGSTTVSRRKASCWGPRRRAGRLYHCLCAT
jgi:nitroreductase